MLIVARAQQRKRQRQISIFCSGVQPFFSQFLYSLDFLVLLHQGKRTSRIKIKHIWRTSLFDLCLTSWQVCFSCVLKLVPLCWSAQIWRKSFRLVSNLHASVFHLHIEIRLNRSMFVASEQIRLAIPLSQFPVKKCSVRSNRFVAFISVSAICSVGAIHLVRICNLRTNLSQVLSLQKRTRAEGKGAYEFLSHYKKRTII